MRFEQFHWPADWDFNGGPSVMQAYANKNAASLDEIVACGERRRWESNPGWRICNPLP